MRKSLRSIAARRGGDAYRAALSFWDALIVQAAIQVGAERLISEDLQNGRRFGVLTIENPFPRRPKFASVADALLARRSGGSTAEAGKRPPAPG